MAETGPDRASHLVVVGSSAGGIEALCTLLGSLPAGFPAAVVLSQHVDPARPSFLGSILERKTPLPVVLEGAQKAFTQNKRWVGGRMGVEPLAPDRPGSSSAPRYPRTAWAEGWPESSSMAWTSRSAPARTV